MKHLEPWEKGTRKIQGMTGELLFRYLFLLILWIWRFLNHFFVVILQMFSNTKNYNFMTLDFCETSIFLHFFFHFLKRGVKNIGLQLNSASWANIEKKILNLYFSRYVWRCARRGRGRSGQFGLLHSLPTLQHADHEVKRLHCPKSSWNLQGLKFIVAFIFSEWVIAISACSWIIKIFSPACSPIRFFQKATAEYAEQPSLPLHSRDRLHVCQIHATTCWYVVLVWALYGMFIYFCYSSFLFFFFNFLLLFPTNMISGRWIRGGPSFWGRRLDDIRAAGPHSAHQTRLVRHSIPQNSHSYSGILYIHWFIIKRSQTL